ncbi:kelch repeat protein-like protein [Rhizodiscina lignyota]|uniref:Kelch repeat protein-like protein n=1 Tax=Rhizodiscina lignyota TaxID=1504668 RepID=A0A9P4I7E6_9PEZI|nr:kelch repeat protein-like protein [Rhizodiscina lignyota]
MATMKGKWTKIASSSSIQRSSQVLSVVNNNLDNNALIFGGELKPRQPVDDKCDVPPARVGSASATIGDTLYLFSGRGGPSMKPLDEAGSLWALSLNSTPKYNGGSLKCAWPDPRSYHAMTSDGQGTIYLHAGCPSVGRLTDLWAFQLHARRWIRLADAPSPARGGTSITFAHKLGETCGKLYRMNGFDGKNEQGGAIDVYDLEMDYWSSIKFKADGIEGPEPRSVGCLLHIIIAGRECLVTFGGERDPSSLGHEGAGKMLGDAWVWDLVAGGWSRVEVEGEEPCARGWFAADAVRRADGTDGIVVHGGLDEQNQRMGDVWVLTL